PVHDSCIVFFLLNATSPTELYTLSLHDALPIFGARGVIAECAAARVDRAHERRIELPARDGIRRQLQRPCAGCQAVADDQARARSEEHTSELQSRSDLVCRLLLEKKKPEL